MRIISVEEASAAERAGLKCGDRIETVDGARVESTEDCRQALRNHQRGSPLEFVIARGDDHSDRIPISVPRFGSPSAILHDAMVRANASGGPLVDLEGNVVAINVADTHVRLLDDQIASNIAIPAAVVQSIVAMLIAKQVQE
ncbi:MAG: PDZ domain-containing protein [Planctomycetota bacterium]|nr:PDZ domain-containing protein [Planctomycetota bacterium]